MTLRSGKTDVAVATEAFRALPSAHREILTETVLRGRSVNEAATFLGITVDEVKYRVHRALRAFSVALDA